MKLNQRKVLITGASSGIGQEIAKILITKYDCHVLGIARNSQKLSAFKNSLGERSANFDYFPMDVGIEDNWKELFKNLTTQNKTIEIVINCAGIMLPFKSTDKTDVGEFERVMQTNYFSVVYCCNTFIPMLLKQKNPAIINIGSLAALCCIPGVGGYAASKAALKSYSEALSVELGKNVFISTIMPGFIKTNILGGGIMHPDDEKLINKFAQASPKAAKTIVRKIKLNRRRPILGFDALLLSFLYKIFPRSSGRIVGNFFKLTKRKTVKGMYTNKNDYIKGETDD